jgi:hypothetical protein
MKQARRRRSDDPGAAVLETALVAPLVVLLLLVLAEGALTWRDHAAATDAVGAAARAAALHPPTRLVRGQGGLAAVLTAAQDALATVPGRTVERIVVYAPETGSGPAGALARVPAGCRHGDGPLPGERCLVLVSPTTSAGEPAHPSDCGEPVNCPWRFAWPSPDRPAEVGVYLRLRRSPLLVGMAGGSGVEVAAVSALEIGRAS